MMYSPPAASPPISYPHGTRESHCRCSIQTEHVGQGLGEGTGWVESSRAWRGDRRERQDRTTEKKSGKNERLLCISFIPLIAPC